MNTSFDIQKAVMDDLIQLFQEDRFLSPAGNERALNFYRQEVPAPAGDDDDTDQDIAAAPYCLVKLIDGSFQEWNYTRKTSLVVVFCIYDPAPEKQGHEKILELIDKTFKHYAQEQWIGNSQIELPLEWAVQSDMDTYPFYFGALTVNLTAGGVKINENELT